VATLPYEIDFTIYSGATYRREFRWLPDGKTPQDFTGWTARFLIGQQRGHAIITMTTDSGVTLGADGMVRIDVPPAATANLRLPNLAHQLDLIDSNGVVMRFLRGRVRVVRDVEEPV
jgi:hypothetical protein